MPLCWVLHFIYYYADRRYAERRYAERRYAECRYAECRSASQIAVSAECRGATRAFS